MNNESYEKLMYFRCIQCNWFGLRDTGEQCEHPEFVRRLYGHRQVTNDS